MAYVFDDRVQEASTSAGTGSITLAGNITGFVRFADAPMVVGDTCIAFVEGVDGAGVPTGEWEIGEYTYSATNTLARPTTPIASSNAGAVVNFSAGTKRVSMAFSAQLLQQVKPPTLSFASSTAEQVIARWELPPNYLFEVGRACRAIAAVQAANSGTFIYRLRIGTAGTTADGLVATISTTATQAANAQHTVEFLFSLASATTVRGNGFGVFQAALLGTPTAANTAVTVAPNARLYVSITVQTATAQVGTVLAADLFKGG